MALVHEYLIQWDAFPDPGIERWEIYAYEGTTPPEDRQDPGVCVGHACASARSATIELPEGEYVVQVLPRSMGGQLPAAWTKQTYARLLAGLPSRQVASLRNPAAGIADLRLAGMVLVDPRQFGDDAHRIEVIEGPTAQKGAVVARVDIPGLVSADGDRDVRLASVPVPVSGLGLGGTSRTITVRALSRDGRPGAVSTFTSRAPLPQDFRAITIASIVGTTRTNFPAPASTDGYELDGTDGVRLKAVPLSQDATAGNWGALSATLLPLSGLAYYVNEAVLTSDEVDLGHKLLFCLDAWADRQRKSDTIPTILGRDAMWPSAPHLHPLLKDTAPSPGWAMREITGEGKPMSPLPPPYWEVATGDASPVGAWRPLLPGEYIAARYVQVRVTLRDPTGLYQLIAPSLYARALVPLRTVAGSGTVPGSSASTTVTVPADPITGASPFQSQMIIMLTPRTADRSLYVSAKASTANPPTFDVTHRTIEGTPQTPGTDTDFDYLVTGY